ncbi:MAG TPA: MarR family winged helix-turn-helix transcriptional regulator [Candidatus Dormibacteraeota bacterium]|nr:MarR family winged helix-turn-helix transcriptional regulator [Candidatus Dormibacteraeota bacterium]
MKPIPKIAAFRPGHLGNAFLIAQLGAHGARRYAERIAALDLTPPQVGVLVAIARNPGRSQLALAGDLQTPPTRLVTLLDALEERGAVERRRNPDDRRNNAIHLTQAGGRLMAEIGAASVAHELDFTAALDEEERGRLRALLTRIADQQGLIPGVHPGMREPGSAH